MSEWERKCTRHKSIRHKTKEQKTNLTADFSDFGHGGQAEKTEMIATKTHKNINYGEIK